MAQAGKELAQVLSETESEERAMAVSLSEDCLQLRRAIKELRQTASQFPAIPSPKPGSHLSALLQQRRLQAEIQVWKEQLWKEQQRERPPHLKDHGGRAKLAGSLVQLRETLETVKRERKDISKELEREQKYLEETRLLADALEEKEKEMVKEKEKEKKENQASTESHSASHLENKLEMSRNRSQALHQHLESFVEEHLTLSSDRKKGGKKSKAPSRQTTLRDIAPDNIPLAQFVKDLMACCLDSPHKPYLPVAGVSEDHLQLLLRSGVVQRHPTQPSTLVRMTPFHH